MKEENKKCTCKDCKCEKEKNSFYEELTENLY